MILAALLRRLRLSQIAACFIVLLLAVARVATAHVHLQRTDPMPGTRLDSVPRQIRFWFSESVQMPFTAVTLTAADGSVIPLRPPVAATKAGEVDVAIEPALSAGTYTVAWRTTSADGHPAHGSFVFTVAANARGLATADSVVTPVSPPAVLPSVVSPPIEAPTFEVSSAAYVIIRWLSFSALLIAVGSVVFLAVVLPRVGGPAAQALARDARSLGAAAAWSLIALTLMRFGAQWFALRGAPGMAGPSMSAMLTGSAWGIGWVGELLLALALALTVRGAGTGITVGIAALLSFMPALSGHPMSMEALTPVMVLSDGVHVFAAAAWLGTLFVITTVGLSAALRLESTARMQTVAAMVDRFSPMAMASAGAMVLTGGFAAWAHLRSLSALTESAYGKVLLVKLACFAAILAFGAFHQNISRRRLAKDASATVAFRRSALAELGLATVLLIVTAILVVTSPPFPR
ncbi:MAG: copper resistance protein CopC [Gemmatimonadota bacterium]|nr:copper resistance protein CopC [Gemmatimonadota bacterium]